jgi:hypothetical protein
MIMNKTVKTVLLSIMLTALFCGCSPEFWHPDEERISNIDPSSPADLVSYLATLPTNTASSPHKIELKVTSEEEFSTIKAALDGAWNKYVFLDLTGSSITIIPSYAFRGTSYSSYGCATLIGIIIPDSVTSIYHYAFQGCTNLASITIPDSVTRIEESAFSDCTSLANVTIGNNVTSIDSQVFYHCTSLANVIIPDSVTSIGYGAFWDCISLASVTIGNGVTSIEILAFENCTSLTSINVNSGNNTYTSENGILYSKDKKTLVSYPGGKKDFSFIILNSVTSIGRGAFYDCTSLASVTIPDSVTSIGYSAFDNCSSLASVTFQGTIPSSGFSTDSGFSGDLRAKFYATDSSSGTPGTYTRPSGSSQTWTLQ